MKEKSKPTPTPATNPPTYKENNLDIAAYLRCLDVECTGYDGSAYVFDDTDGTAHELAKNYREDVIFPVEPTQLRFEKVRLAGMAKAPESGHTAAKSKGNRKRPPTKPHKQAEENARPIRALLDVIGGTRDESGKLQSRIPRDKFGTDKARILRKFVLVAIAASANADGSDAWPSKATLAERCLVSERAIGDVLNWLEENDLIVRESKAVPIPGKKTHTNRYHIMFPDA